MRTWKWLGLACCFVGALGYGYLLSACGGRRGADSLSANGAGSGSSGRGSGSSGTGLGLSDDRCRALHGIPSTPSVSTSAADDCQPDGCGLNGVWLGKEVSFRTLHLPSVNGGPAQANEAGIRIADFKKGAINLIVDVQGQELLGRNTNSQTVLDPHDLVGSKLLLEHVDSTNQPDNNYTLLINHVIDQPFWARCSGDNCSAMPEKALVYDFTVTAKDGCKIELCKPGLDENSTNLSGKAVIFRGDLYTDDYQVSEGAGTRNADIFNIACVGTDLHKLHMMRHTAASSISPKPTPVKERQAMLRLLTADYCGTGHPFTENGIPIRIGFKDPDYTPTTISKYLPDNVNNKVSSIDAMWTADRASCITVPRWLSKKPDVVTLIQNTCPLPPPCPSPPSGADMPTFMKTLLVNTPETLAISGNP